MFDIAADIGALITAAIFFYPDRYSGKSLRASYKAWIFLVIGFVLLSLAAS